MKRRTEVETKERESVETERVIKEYQRKEARNQETVKRLEKLKKDIAAKQLLYMYKEAVMSDHFRTIEVWEEQDYSYLEYYCGTEYMENIKEIEKKKQLQEAIQFEQDLVESLELKKKELMLKLEQVQEKFLQSFKDVDMSLELYSHLSHAFVFSYFDCSPDLTLQTLIGKTP